MPLPCHSARGLAWPIVGLMLALLQCAPAPAAAPAAATPAPAPTIAAAATAAPAARPAAQPLNPSVAVKAGVLGISTEAGLYIALEKGYFREEGLETETVTFGRPPDQLSSLATGELHFASLGPDASLFNAMARDIDVKLVGLNSVVVPDDPSAGLVVRQDLLDGGRYREPRDLKGLTIAMSSPGAIARMCIDRILARTGLADTDVEFTLLPFPEMITGLANRAVDAAWTTEPFISLGESRGTGKLAIPIGDPCVGIITQALWVSPVFARDQPEAARRFVTAHLRGQRDYYRAFLKNEGGRDEIIDILVKHTQVKDPAQYARMAMHGVDPNGQVDARMLDTMQERFVEYGTQQQKIDLGKVIDRAYIDYALERLGRAS